MMLSLLIESLVGEVMIVLISKSFKNKKLREILICSTFIKDKHRNVKSNPEPIIHRDNYS